MNGTPPDRDLEDLFGDPELERIGRLLAASRLVDPPLDRSFQSSLRRRLMKEAWGAQERGFRWRRVLGARPRFAWAVGAVALLAIGIVAVSNSLQLARPYQLSFVRPVANDQPIVIKFSQPVDHQAVEASLHIQPATRVNYQWVGNNLYIRPQSGLAPDTQYKVSVHANGVVRSSTITFISRPSPTPVPPPVQPAPIKPKLLGVRQVGTGVTGVVGWSGSTVYYLGQGGALMAITDDGQGQHALGVTGVTEAVLLPGPSPALAFVNGSGVGVVPAGGGAPQVVDPGGALALGVAPAGPAPAASETTTTASATTTRSTTTTTTTTSSAEVPLANRLVYVQGSAVYAVQGDGSRAQVASLAAGPTAAWLVAGNVIYRDATGQLHTVRLGTTASDHAWGVKAAGPLVPGGNGVVFAGVDGLYTAGLQGQSPVRLVTYAQLGLATPAGLSLAVQGTNLLVGTGKALYGLSLATAAAVTELGTGQFADLTWAPDGVALAFTRGAALYSASVQAPGSAPSLQEGDGVIAAFMQTRIAGNATAALQYLDPAGQQAYERQGTRLTYTGALRLDRYFIVLSQAVPAQGSLQYVDRLLLAQGAVEQRQFDEALTLTPGPGGKLLVHAATVGPVFPVDSGPQVVAVSPSTNGVQITFDSDLDAGTVPGTFTITSPGGTVLPSQAAYANRVVTITYTGAVPGAAYTLTVGSALHDIDGTPLTQPYSLSYFSPAS